MRVCVCVCVCVCVLGKGVFFVLSVILRNLVFVIFGLPSIMFLEIHLLFISNILSFYVNISAEKSFSFSPISATVALMYNPINLFA